MNSKLLIALLLVSATAAAEENCGRTIIDTIRIDGTIEAIEPLNGQAKGIDVGSANPRFLVRLRPIEGTSNAWTPPPLRSRIIDIAVHSPIQLGIERGPGRFQFESMSCYGKFRRLIGFERVPLAPMEFAGWPEEGGLYRAEVVFKNGFLKTKKPLIPSMHHLAAIHWINLDEFSHLRDGEPATIVFSVEKRETEYRSEREWRTSWDCKIREALPPTRGISRRTAR